MITERWIKPQLLRVTKLLDGLTWFVNSFTDINRWTEQREFQFRRINSTTACPTDTRFLSSFVLIPLHFVPMISKASYNGCDQRIIHVYSCSRKYLSAYYEKACVTFYIKHFDISSVTKCNCHEHVDKIWKQSENAQCEHRSYKNHFLCHCNARREYIKQLKFFFLFLYLRIYYTYRKSFNEPVQLLFEVDSSISMYARHLQALHVHLPIEMIHLESESRTRSISPVYFVSFSFSSFPFHYNV